MSWEESLEEVLEQFIPKQSSLYKIGNGATVILKEDLDGDGVEELLGLFKQEEQIKLVAIKKQDEKWTQAWYRGLIYDTVRTMELISSKAYLLLIGKKEGAIGTQLFRWQPTGIVIKDELPTRFEHLIYTEIDGINLEIGWLKNNNKDYEIELYEIDHEGFKRIPEADERYFTYMQAYRRKNIGQEEQIDRKDEKRMSSYEEGKVLKSQSIILWGEEQELFFIGGVDYKKIYNPYILIQSITTKEAITWEVPVREIEDYELIIGAFKEGNSEQIFLDVNKGNELIRGTWLLEILQEGVVEYLEMNEKETVTTKYQHYIESNQRQNGSWQVYAPYSEEAFQLFKVYTLDENKGYRGSLLQRYIFSSDELIKGETLLLQYI